MNLKKNQNFKKAVFRKWKNEAWAVFSSFGKHIRIAVLLTAYFILSNFTLTAQPDTINIWYPLMI